jgi:hypothetical protein
MKKYVVKVGDLYSTGSPGTDMTQGSLGLKLTPNQKEAFKFGEGPYTSPDQALDQATRHAVAWTGDAISEDLPTPRVVRLKSK